MTHTPMTIEELKRMAGIIRCDIIEMICTAGAGHPGGSLSAADVVTALYFRVMRIDPQEPRLARPRPLHPVQGPRLPGVVRGAGRARVFRQETPRDPAPAGQHPAGASGHAQDARAWT